MLFLNAASEMQPCGSQAVMSEGWQPAAKIARPSQAMLRGLGLEMLKTKANTLETVSAAKAKPLAARPKAAPKRLEIARLLIWKYPLKQRYCYQKMAVRGAGMVNPQLSGLCCFVVTPLR